MQLPWNVLKGRGYALFLQLSWNADMMPGVGAAILDHEVGTLR